MAAKDQLLERGLPSSPDTERVVLGSVLLNYQLIWPQVEGLAPEVFSVEKHRRIFARMADLAIRGEAIDRVTLADELIKWGQLEQVDGLAYLVSLDEGLPEISNIESYCKILLTKHHARKLIFAAQKIIDANLIGEQPPEATLAAFEEVTRDLGEQKKEQGRSVDQVIREYPNGIGAFLDPTIRPKGLPTPWGKYNELTGGLYSRQLVVIGGYTGTGKSILAANIAMHVLETSPNPVLVFSMEMAASVWIERILCAKASVYRNRFKRGMETDERSRIQEALAWLSDSPLTIVDKSGMTAADVTRTVRRFAKKAHYPPLVVLDYLQLMGREKGSRGDNRSNEVAANSRANKIVCQETESIMLELSQLHRAGKTDGPPGVHNLRDSGAIEEDADAVALIHMPGLNKLDRPDMKEEAYLILDKVRDGERGRVPLRFRGGLMRFDEAMEPPAEH